MREWPEAFPAGYFRQKAAKAANAGFAALVFGKTGCNCSCNCPCPCSCNCNCTCSCLSHRERQKTLCADGGIHRLLRRGRRLPPVWDRTRQSAPPGIPRARPPCRSRRSGGAGPLEARRGRLRPTRKPGPSGRPGTRLRVGRERPEAFG